MSVIVEDTHDVSSEDEIEEMVTVKPMAPPPDFDLEKKKVDLMQKLDNLLEQSRALLEGPKKPVVTKKKNSSRRRMSELEEDEELLKIEEEDDAPITVLDVQPAVIENGSMKKYQIDGLNWLIRLHENKVNGILADEMGLGKTLQSISMLGYLSQFRNIKRPFIIVVPKSTLGNWMRELKKWCPSLKPFRFHGDQEQRSEMVKNVIRPGDFDVIVTSYEVAISEKASLKKIDWYYMIVDEAHRLKNENSVLSVTLRQYNCAHRLLLTGTPLQNNLHELWALLNFLLPKLFDSAEEFDAFFVINQVQGTDGSSDIVSKLHKILRPFLLRRLKVDVASDLPPKKETLLYVGLSEMQKQWYKSILHKDFDALNGQCKDRSRLLNMVMQLRKCANHPYLFEGAEDRSLPAYGDHIIENCGKLKLLDKLLPKLKAQGSRVLIFSQMTRVLDILDDYMIYRGYKSCRIDGNTEGEVRDSSVEAFNAPNSELFVFLLSTRAGGLGINLATADTVVLYDSDWNPQMDLQAQDRAHRIGQKKPVNVYRLVTESTIEEQIIERASFKLHLDAVIIQQGRLAAQSKALSKDDMIEMIRFGADQIFRSKNATITDDDIDIIMARGASKTAEMNEKIQAATGNGKMSLHNFSLSNNDDVFAAEKKTKDFLFMNSMNDAMGKRERKMKTDAMGTYNEQLYYREKLFSSGKDNGPRVPRPKKLPVIHDFQFYNRARIQELADIENLAYTSFNAGQSLESIVGLTEAQVEEREKLLAEGFSDWSRRDHHALMRAFERIGKSDLNALCRCFPSKSPARVAEYLNVLWSRLDELADKNKILKNVEKGEAMRLKNRKFAEIIETELALYSSPRDELVIKYPKSKSKTGYNDEEDRFLIVETHNVGYGEWDMLRKTVQTAPLFRFDYFIKSRSPAELSRRVDQLIRFLDKSAKPSKTTDGAAVLENITNKKRKDLVESDSTKGSKKIKSKAT